ncbi:MAG: pseudouridine synthase [Lachnospiraceae bacterium]|nr:pseudouridine synthase [Lachnospiraceae bacterium]
MEDNKVRINKYLAEAGICSRRGADELILQGKVTINGKIAQNGDKVGPGDDVRVSGKKASNETEKVVLAYYKPVGVTVTEKDAHAKKTIRDVIDYPVRVTYAGRLDKDSEGLLLLTNDGDLINAMMRGSNRHEKEYVVKTDREIEQNFAEKMSAGMYLKELKSNTRPCEVTIIGKNTFRIILTQGLNRQIRRMCENLGVKVKSLKRLRVVNVELGNLKPGEYRQVSGEELKKLYEICGMK